MSQVYQVSGMSCGHCVAAVTEAVRGVDPGATVAVDLAAGRVVVGGTAPPAAVIAAIVDAGYAAEAA